MRRTLILTLTLALPAACSSGSPVADGLSALPSSSRLPPAERPKAWMAGDAGHNDLLYVTKPNDGVVEVLTYPKGQPAGQLTGLAWPLGTCVDKTGDVYVTDYTAGAVAEFAHGGSQPLRTLTVPKSGPIACAVDRRTGDLAVTTAGNSSSASAAIIVFRKAKGRGKAYTAKTILNYDFCTYDNAGDLFVDGTPAPGYGYDFQLAELPRGSGSLEPVDVANGLSWGAPLQQNGGDLLAGRPVSPSILRYTVNGGYATEVGSTALADAYDAVGFIIAGSKAIVINEYYVNRYVARWNVLLYRYPAGGDNVGDLLESSTPLGSVALSKS